MKIGHFAVTRGDSDAKTNTHTHTHTKKEKLFQFRIFVDFAFRFSFFFPFSGLQFCTALGALIVPMTYSTMWDLTESNVAALIASSYLLFDVGMLTLNQYILLDPILLCFMTASVMGMVKISKYTQQQRTFSKRWWWWLLFTGSMLACTISVKFVGLFVVLLVGLHTINDLWIELGDLSKPVVGFYLI